MNGVLKYMMIMLACPLDVGYMIMKCLEFFILIAWVVDVQKRLF